MRSLIELTNTRTVMTISDSEALGVSGIQSDLKTFDALGAYGTSVLTAVTELEAGRVVESSELPASLVYKQIDSVVSGVRIDAVKTGMLIGENIIETVSDTLLKHKMTNIVADPVVITQDGERILDDNSITSFRKHIIPLSKVITLNRATAGLIVGCAIDTLEDTRDAAREITDMGAESIVITDERQNGPSTDLLYHCDEFRAFTSRRVLTNNSYSAGVRFSAAIAAGLANYLSVRDAVSQAKKYVTKTLPQA